MTYKIHKSAVVTPAAAPPHELALMKTSTGIHLCVVNKDGNPLTAGYLLTIMSDGEVRLHNNVANKFGFHWQEHLKRT